MTRPRRSDPDLVAKAERILAETASFRDMITLRDAHPGKLIRNPCGEPATCTHGHCYGTVEEAEHRRRTGLLPGQGGPQPVDRGQGFRAPQRGATPPDQDPAPPE